MRKNAFCEKKSLPLHPQMELFPFLVDSIQAGAPALSNCMKTRNRLKLKLQNRPINQNEKTGVG